MPSIKKRLLRGAHASVRSLSDPLGPLAPSLPSVNRTVHRYQASPSPRSFTSAALAVSSYIPAGGSVGRASKLSRGLGFTRSAEELPMINARTSTRMASSARSSLSSIKRAASSRISSAGSSLPAQTSRAGGVIARSRLGRGLALGVGASQLATRIRPEGSSSSSSSSISSAQGLQAVAAVHALHGDPGVSALTQGLRATRARLVGTGSTPATEGRGRIRSIGNPPPDRSAILREEVKKAFALRGPSGRSLRGGLT